MYRYLVMRKDIIRSESRSKTINSSCFPVLVESEFSMEPEEAVRMALDTFSKGYRGLHTYVVVPMDYAREVSFRRPQPQYEMFVNEFRW